jgi:hypothetical protein
MSMTAPSTARHRPWPAEPQAAAITTFDRASCSGRLSLLADGPLRIDAEPGLCIRVHDGCLWLPATGNAVGMVLSNGQHAELDRAGPTWAMAMRRSEIELDWPAPPAAEATARR